LRASLLRSQIRNISLSYFGDRPAKLLTSTAHCSEFCQVARAIRLKAAFIGILAARRGLERTPCDFRYGSLAAAARPVGAATAEHPVQACGQ
jgi:hypothetical protein